MSGFRLRYSRTVIAILAAAMSNKDVVFRQWYQELWDKWNVSMADELFTDYRLHLPGSATALDRDATNAS